MTGARSLRAFTTPPVLLLFGFSLFWFADTIADPDLWGHIRFGTDITEAQSVLLADRYSYRTAGERWVNHEWLAEVIFAGLYRAAGQSGLIVFKLLVATLVVRLCFVHLRRMVLGPHGSAILIMISCIPFRLGFGTIRPQIFTYLFFLLELFVLEKGSRSSVRWLWLLPPIFAIWVNLHGGVLAGIGILGIWIAARAISLLSRSPGPARRPLESLFHLASIGAISAAALLLNPYGSELVVFLLRTATVARPEITEWVPLAITSVPGFFYLLLLTIGAAGLIASHRTRAPEAVVIFVVASLLPLVSNRHYPLFALALVVLAGEHIADVWNRQPWSAWAHHGRRRRTSVACILLAMVMLASSIPRFGCIHIDPYYFAFPARAVALLKRSGLSGNMAVPFDWGEYVLWHLGPRIKVSIDGRRETIYSDRMYRQSRDFEHGTGVWNALLNESKTDLVLTPIGSPTGSLLAQSADWVPLYRDSYCLIFVRRGLPGLDQIAATPVSTLPDNGGGLCFPAPVASGDELTRSGNSKNAGNASGSH